MDIMVMTGMVMEHQELMRVRLRTVDRVESHI